MAEVEISLEMMIGVVTLVGVLCGAIGWLWKKAYDQGSDDAGDESTIEAMDHKIDDLASKVDTAYKEMKEHIDDDKENFKKVNEKIETTIAQEVKRAEALHKEMFAQLRENNRTLGEITGTLAVIKERLFK